MKKSVGRVTRRAPDQRSYSLVQNQTEESSDEGKNYNYGVEENVEVQYAEWVPAVNSEVVEVLDQSLVKNVEISEVQQSKRVSDELAIALPKVPPIE